MSELKNMDIMNIPKEKFKFSSGDISHDKKFETKPRTYFQDAMSRFCKNKGAIVGAIVILFLFLYAAFGSLLTPYAVSYNDTYFIHTLPKCEWFANTNFWDGCEDKSLNKETFDYYYYIGEESGHNAIKNQKYTQSGKLYNVRWDSYHSTGCIYKKVEAAEYENIQKYQNETGIQVIYPTVAKRNRPASIYVGQNMIANYWYKTEAKNGRLQIVYDENGDIIPVYKSHEEGKKSNDNYNSIRIEGDGENGMVYEYALPIDTGYEIRVNYYEYYIYYHSYVLKDGIEKPSFLFGTTNGGQDIFTCMASGAFFSFAFAIAVAVVNLTVGAIYGAIEGYYGGKLDLAMERFSEILGSIPTVIVITLLRLHMGNSGPIVILFVAFFATGWIGMAASTRMQFYRFKNQEYVLAARTLGAKDRRIIWKHVFPNALGTLVTKCALIIPSMIYSEVNLSYLGIISLTSGDLTSVGTILANGQGLLRLGIPHVAMFPAVFLALLLLSFNLFGNGLRDAFNPSLRGSED
ncbi:MAG: ABC transporter permease [Clostridia bacterium]|nr:ABC transporter permease [Clostridia bacterium]